MTVQASQDKLKVGVAGGSSRFLSKIFVGTGAAEWALSVDPLDFVASVAFFLPRAEREEEA